MKDYQGREKGLLRSAMEGFLPEQVLYRKKSPYPKTYDPKYTQLVYGRLQELIGKPDAPIFALVDRSELGRILDSEYTWPWYGQLMKGPQTAAFMLQLDFWLRHYRVKVL